MQKRIEQFAPELEKIISGAELIQELASGFGGPHGPAEGPVWSHEGGYLLFSDIHNDRRMKYEPGVGVSVLQTPTNRANGLTRDQQGRLIACENAAPGSPGGNMTAASPSSRTASRGNGSIDPTMSSSGRMAACGSR